MNAVKEIANRMIDELPDEMMPDVISYLIFIKSEIKNRVFKDMAEASLSSADFWDNDIDDEVWNNA